MNKRKRILLKDADALLRNGSESSKQKKLIDREYTRYLTAKAIEYDCSLLTEDPKLRSKIYRLLEVGMIELANSKDEARTDPVIPSSKKLKEVVNGFLSEYSGKKLDEGTVKRVGEIFLSRWEQYLQSSSQNEINSILIEKNGIVVNEKVFLPFQELRMELLYKRNDSFVKQLEMILRYESILIHSQQWSIPLKVAEFLYRDCGLRIEAFASPLNSFALNFPHTNFCSLFGDTDKAFGSLGDFFSQPASVFEGKTIAANPPFFFEMFQRLEQKIGEIFSHVSCARFLCFHPTRSSYFFDSLKRYREVSITLMPEEYYWENAVGEKVPQKYPTDILVFTKGFEVIEDFEVKLRKSYFTEKKQSPSWRKLRLPVQLLFS